MFRLLKGYRTTGYAYFSKTDFKELFYIPKNYRQSNIDQYVISPIKEELVPLFKGLTIRKKYGKGRGKPVISYAFAWKAERKDAEDVHVSQEQRLSDQIFNIEHNADLSGTEKWRAIDKVKGQRLGTTEKEKLTEKQKQHDKEIEGRVRIELLEKFRQNNELK